MTPLTEAQRRVLEFIGEFIKANGFPPTRQQIADRFEYASSSACDVHLKALERKGFLSISPGISRGLKILKACEA